MSSKPKLVFFQYKYDPDLPTFLVTHKLEHAKCLECFFDVTVVDYDCDYERICERYAPDVTLFESGLDNLTCVKPKIANTRACASVPKLGLHNADAFSGARAGFLSDMDHWGIETFFVIAVTAAEHTPEIASRALVWPNFVDSETYRDYGEWKSVPVLLTGNTQAFYPWRHRVFKLIAERFPALVMPHPGYAPRTAAPHFLHGERYARTINASWIVPACGTVAKEVVRKHFEIPACRACLVAEPCPALEAAGFRDMENCVFASEQDVVDKLTFLFNHPEELERVTNAGYELVHSRHTMLQRDQIRQWLELHRNLRPGGRIVQANPFEPMAVEDAEKRETPYIVSNGLHLELLERGRELIRTGDYRAAENAYRKVLHYVRWMPEAKLGLARCCLYQGDARAAESWIEQCLVYILGRYQAADPDPVEWAWFIVCQLCQGKTDAAAASADEFPTLHHPELDRVRNAVRLLRGETAVPVPEGVRRLSIHPVFNQALEEWTDEICRMLTASGQQAIAKTLWARLQAPHVSSASKAARTRLAARPRVFERLASRHRAKMRVRRVARRVLHRLEAKCGWFLPYGISLRREDEFFKAVAELAREEDIRTALIVAGSPRGGSAEAFLAGALENQNKPRVFSLNASRPRLRSRIVDGPLYWGVAQYDLASFATDGTAPTIEKAVATLREQNSLRSFDAVVLDGDGYYGGTENGGPLQGAKLIVLDDITSADGFARHERLSVDPHYRLVASNPELRKGYAIFKAHLGESAAVR